MGPKAPVPEEGVAWRLFEPPRLAWFCFTVLAVTGCEGGDVSWALFNTLGDTLRVAVGSDEPAVQEDRCQETPSLCEGLADCICLRSSLQAHDVGWSTVGPSFGPVGTRHTFRVEVSEDFSEIVQRATVFTSGERGEDEIELQQDSASAGSWAVELESLGAADEVRLDTFEVRLYEPDGDFSGDEEVAEVEEE